MVDTDCAVKGKKHKGEFKAVLRIKKGGRLGPHTIAGNDMNMDIFLCGEHRDLAAKSVPLPGLDFEIVLGG